MDINATLLGQMITFAIFVVITMKWIWPLFKNMLDERAKKIAEGLAASEQGHRDLELAKQASEALFNEAKQRANHVLQESNQRSQVIMDTAKAAAQVESERIVAQARHEIEQEETMAKEKLRREVVRLAVMGAEKILQREVNANDAEKIIASTAAEL
jgi:F-type H+-transporting ATPase subunit b